MKWNEWNEMTWHDMKWNDMKWMSEYTSKCIDECANKSVNTNIIFSSLARRWVPCLQQHGRGSSEREQLLLRSLWFFNLKKSRFEKTMRTGVSSIPTLWPWDLPMFHKELLTEPPVRQGLCEAMVSPYLGNVGLSKKGGESDQGNIANLTGNMRFLNRQTHIVGYYPVGVRILLKECFYD